MGCSGPPPKGPKPHASPPPPPPRFAVERYKLGDWHTSTKPPETEKPGSVFWWFVAGLVVGGV